MSRKDPDRERSRRRFYAIPVAIGGSLLLAVMLVVGLNLSWKSDSDKTAAVDPPPVSASLPSPQPVPASAQPPPGPATDPGKESANVKVPEIPPEKVDLPGRARAGSVESDALYQSLLRSAVIIYAEEGGHGSGSLVDRANKLVLTNAHVVEQAKKPIVFFPAWDKGIQLITNNRFYESRKKTEGIHGQVVLKDDKKDLALIRLWGLPDGARQLPLAAASAKPGQRVHSVGSPGGSDSLWAYTFGTVRTERHRKSWISGGSDGTITAREADVIETQNPTNPGDSGGPLVNDRSQLVAVTQGGRRDATLINFFIDVTEVRRVLTRYYKEQNLKPGIDNIDQPGETPPDVPVLLKRLEDKDPVVRRDAARGLAEMGVDARAAVAPLAKVLKDSDVEVRKAAADALVQIGILTRSEVPALGEALKDSNPDVRKFAAAALAKIGAEAKEAVPALTKALEDPDPELRQNAVRALGKIGPEAKSAVEPLAKLLTDLGTHLDVRVEAAGALAKIGREAKAVVKQLGEALKQPDKNLKLNVLAAFAAIGPDGKAAVPEMIRLLRDRDKDIQEKAVEALAAIGPDAKDAVRQLVIRLDTKDKEARERVVNALGKIGKAAVDDLIKTLRTRNPPEVLLAAIDVLESIGPDAKAAVPTLKGLERHPIEDVREKARIALKNIEMN